MKWKNQLLKVDYMDYKTEGARNVAHTLIHYEDRDEMLEPQLKALLLLENTVDNLEDGRFVLTAIVDDKKMHIDIGAELASTDGNEFFLDDGEFEFVLEPDRPYIERSPVCIKPGQGDIPYFDYATSAAQLLRGGDTGGIEALELAYDLLNEGFLWSAATKITSPLNRMSQRFADTIMQDYNEDERLKEILVRYDLIDEVFYD